MCVWLHNQVTELQVENLYIVSIGMHEGKLLMEKIVKC